MASTLPSVSPSQEAGPSRSPRRTNSNVSANAVGASPNDPSRSIARAQNANADEEGDPDDPNDPSRKPRTARACSSCNKQKLRCDGGRPCSRCTGLGMQNTCEYLPSLRGKTRKRKADRDKQKDQGGQGHGYGQARVESQDGRRGSESIFEGTKHKPEYFDMWQQENALATTVPRNSTLWGEDRRPASPIRNVPIPNPSPRMGIDNLTTTTLPLPGDAHNPLAVLAEASSTSNPFDPLSPANNYGRKEGDDKGYYAPLERVLKDEAPHIMSRIDVHEWVPKSPSNPVVKLIGIQGRTTVQHVLQIPPSASPHTGYGTLVPVGSCQA